MKEKTKEKLANLLRIIILSAIFSTVIGYSLADWVAPSGSPPFNNVPPPINVGGATQERAGNLILDNWLIAKKAQTQSTVASDVGTTVATKDYVDGQIRAAGAGMKFVQGTGCPACPYGSYQSESGSGPARVDRYSCIFKKEDGTQLAPVLDGNWNLYRICHVDAFGASDDKTFGFWTY